MKTTVDERSAVEQPAAEQYATPQVNIYETGEGYVLEAEMPGVTKDGLQVTLDGSEITITGRREADTVSGDPLLRERALRNYRRVFELDPAIDTGKVSAKMDQGILTLTLPKSERVKPRSIKVD